jgi:hypothetical protein
LSAIHWPCYILGLASSAATQISLQLGVSLGVFDANICSSRNCGLGFMDVLGLDGSKQVGGLGLVLHSTGVLIYGQLKKFVNILLQVPSCDAMMPKYGGECQHSQSEQSRAAQLRPEQ